MGIEVITDNDTGYSVMYCNTTMQAFGPVFYAYDDEDAIAFLEWHERMYTKRDVRSLTPAELVDHVTTWRNEVAAEKYQEHLHMKAEEAREMVMP